MFDTHMHTKFSSDSKMDLKEVLNIINKNNIRAIITDHMDLNYPIPDEFIFDIEKYFHEYSKYRSDKLLLGIELGLRTDCVEQNRKISLDNPFDYVIGSIHVVDNVDIYTDVYYRERSKKDTYIQYLMYIISCLESCDYIDSLGHIDYIARYSPYEDKEIYYRDYSDYIDAILKKVIDKGIIMELNTRRIGEERAVQNLINIYKRYNELGGRFVTIGSDAHVREAIGDNFKIADHIVSKCGLKAVYFKNRTLEYV